MKALKQTLLGGIAHADAGVGDVDLPLHAIAQRFTANTDIDLPLIGVLDGIAEHIEQNLPQAQRVEHHDTRLVQFARQLQLQAFVDRLHPHETLHLLQKVFHVRGFRVHWNFAGLQGRDLQHIVEHSQQVGCAAHGGLNQIGLFGSGLGFLEQSQHSQYAVERCAQLVTHVGEKTTFSLIGAFGLFFGLQQLGIQKLLRPLCLGLLALMRIQAHSAQHQTQDLRQR